MFGFIFLAVVLFFVILLLVFGRNLRIRFPIGSQDFTPMVTIVSLDGTADPDLEDIISAQETSVHATSMRATMMQITPVQKAPTPKPTIVSTLSASCIPYDQVGEEHVRRLICVYGRIEKLQTIEMGGGRSIHIIYFEEEDFNFIVKIYNHKPKVNVGDCIYISGVIKEAHTYYLMEYKFIKNIKEVPIYFSDQCE